MDFLVYATGVFSKFYTLPSFKTAGYELEGILGVLIEGLGTYLRPEATVNNLHACDEGTYL